MKIGLKFFAGATDTSSMKIKLSREARKTASVPEEAFSTVKAFLAASRAAGEPLEQGTIRARIQQDPLGALRERLAPGYAQ